MIYISTANIGDSKAPQKVLLKNQFHPNMSLMQKMASFKLAVITGASEGIGYFFLFTNIEYV